jgi:hypothetical protein
LIPKNTPYVGSIPVQFSACGELLIPKSLFTDQGSEPAFSEVALKYRPPEVDPTGRKKNSADPPIPIFMIADLGSAWIATPNIALTPAYKNSAPIYKRGRYVIPERARGIDRVICEYRLNSLIAAIARKGEDLADIAAAGVDPDLAAELSREVLAAWSPVVQNRRNQLRRAALKARSRPAIPDRAAIF